MSIPLRPLCALCASAVNHQPLYAQVNSNIKRLKGVAGDES